MEITRDSTVNLAQKERGSSFWYIRWTCPCVSVYVDIGSNSGDTATLAFMFDAMAFQRMWDIKVNQIECTSESR